MNPNPLSMRERMQLALLRVMSAVLGLVDGLFRVHWGERVLDRLASRWQAQLAQLDKILTDLEDERQQLHSQAEALAIHAAAIYLGGRSLARGELRFDPADAHDEEILDATIEVLVKERLAAIESDEVEDGRYLYHLELDWAAIRARLAQAADLAAPETAEWFRESLAFIDESFLSEHGD
jgi:hypothetical protein